MKTGATIQFCPSCGERLSKIQNVGEEFLCASCNHTFNPPIVSPGRSSPSQFDDKISTNLRRYPVQVDAADLASFLVGEYRLKGFETQRIEVGSDESIVQIKKSGVARAVFSVTRALTLRIRVTDRGTSIEIGSQAWGDKAGAGIAGLLVFWPSLALMGTGVMMQRKLCKSVWMQVDRYFDLLRHR